MAKRNTGKLMTFRATGPHNLAINYWLTLFTWSESHNHSSGCLRGVKDWQFLLLGKELYKGENSVKIPDIQIQSD